MLDVSIAKNLDTFQMTAQVKRSNIIGKINIQIRIILKQSVKEDHSHQPLGTRICFMVIVFYVMFFGTRLLNVGPMKIRRII